jgi:demethoxyubiquinone hydroxylase (CLK1/Coq7/Cat5 family)
VRKAVEAAARAGGGIVGTVTSLGGDRAALAFDYAVERLIELGYVANLRLLPADARPSDRRVLKRVLDEEREHAALIRDRLGI